MDFWDWYDRAQEDAGAAQVARTELDWLVCQCTSLDRLALRLRSTRPGELEWQKLADLWERRLIDRVPVQYLIGKVTWRNLTLAVDDRVLIPRPETELIPEVIQQVLGSPEGLWGDLGTGSGAIALGLASTFPAMKIYATDVSEGALVVARENCWQLGFTDRIQFFVGDWFGAIPTLKTEKAIFNGIVSNPPYIPSQVVENLAPEVCHHEPRIALDGGKEGLTAIEILVFQGAAYLRSGGFWLSEVMAGQAEIVAQLLESEGSYRNISMHKDLAGIDRFVSAFKE